MLGAIKGMVSSVTEGVGALGESVKHAVKGDWEEAGKDFARVGLEAAGIAGSVFLGPGAEVGAEAIEGALDAAVLERPTGDVPGPNGGKADWSIGNLLQGAVSGGAESAMGVFGGMDGLMGAAGGAGGAGGSLGKIMGMFTGGGGGGGAAGGGLQDLLGSVLGGSPGGGEMGQFTDMMSNFGGANDLLNKLMSSSNAANAKVLMSAL